MVILSTRWLSVLSMIALVLSCLIVVTSGKFVPCGEKTEAEDRKLIVATCDTRSGWKEFHAMKIWNITGKSLREDGLYMKNVCKGENWGRLGFLTKPLLYLNFIKPYLTRPDAAKTHVILMDSDTFWAAEKIKDLWRNYDCARGNKHLVVSTEMSCWVGRYCGQEDLDRWYSNPKAIPSYSPFVNSGVLMGRVDKVAEMLDFVVRNNQSYYTTYGKKYKFDDQLAIADYALKVAPVDAAVDYHQLISASCSIHAPGDPPDEGWPFLCKNRNGTFSFSCHIYNNLLRRQGHFKVEKDTCQLHRSIHQGMALQEELESLSLTPMIWHGNGK